MEERAPISAGARPKEEPPTYRAATRYDLTVAPLDRLDAIVAGIVASGLFEIGSVRFSVADSRAAPGDGAYAFPERLARTASVGITGPQGARFFGQRHRDVARCAAMKRARPGREAGGAGPARA